MAKGRKDFLEDIDPKDKRKISKEGIKKALKVFRFILPYKWPFIAGLVFLALSTSTTLAFPSLIGEITRVIEGNSRFKLNDVILFFVGILILQGIFSFFRIYFFAVVSEKASADIRRLVYNKFISLPISFFEKHRVGELTSRITSDVSAFQSVLSLTLAEFFRQVATLVIGIGIIVYISWKLSLFMLLTFPVIVVAALVFGKYIRKLSKQVQDKLAEANVIVEETLQSVSIVKSFTNEKLESIRYGNAMTDTVKLAMKAATLRGGFITFFIVGLFGGIVLVVWYGGGLVESGEIQLADLMSFLFYTAFIGGSMSGLGDIYAQIQRTVGSSERILEILEEDSEINLDQEVKKENFQASVSYEHVDFAYPSRKDMPVLKDFNLEIKAGEKVALVGQSGAGKSTVVQLLMRFYEIDKGSIKIDGKDIREIDHLSLRKNIGIVPQEVILFGGTIRENILYGNPEATQDDVITAAKRANAMEFIERFPEGMDTVVGERGVKLSGGQRQRLAIARAILKDPAILLLDEATSALDSESENLVQEALNELMKNRTTLIIAHRLATIKDVDRIFVLDKGKIAESGSHDVLIADKKGIYANLIRLQFDKTASVINETVD